MVVALEVFQILNVAIETQLQTLDRMNHLSLFFFFPLMMIFLVQSTGKVDYKIDGMIRYTALCQAVIAEPAHLFICSKVPLHCPEALSLEKMQLLRTELFPLLSIQAGGPKMHQTALK